MLGIIIGVGAVILIMSLGAGAQGLILNQVKAMGTNKIGILPGKADANGPPASAMGIVITTLKYEDAEAIKNSGQIPHVTGVVAYNNSTENVSWRGNSYITTIRGAAGDYFEVEGGELAEGRFFSETEGKSLTKLAILGDDARKELFGDSDPIGQSIKIRKTVFEIIGVMKKKGHSRFSKLRRYDNSSQPNSKKERSRLGLFKCYPRSY